jgi:hypothetical protein
MYHGEVANGVRQVWLRARLSRGAAAVGGITFTCLRACVLCDCLL